MTAPLVNQFWLQKMLVKLKGLEIMLFTNIAYTKHQDNHDLLGSPDSLIPHSRVQSNIVWSRPPILKSLVY